MHNIPTHHAMGLYAAGKVLERPQWCAQAAEFLAKVIAAQSPGGYWSEGGGPVVQYNLDYVEAIGTYYAMSGDPAAGAAVIKASAYHAHFTYPSGQDVEVIDQRNPYNPAIDAGNVGMTFSAEGRSHLARQWKLMGKRLSADLIASLLLYGQTGPLAQTSATQEQQKPCVLCDDHDTPRAMTVRDGPWFIVLSAYTSPVADVRWHQDRQNLVSIWHEKTALLLGGGNTKFQPAWSNFTVGDVGLLVHRPGDTKPNFIPPAGRLFHVPSAARLVEGPEPGLDLTYGPEHCRLRVRRIDPRKIAYRVETTLTSGLPVAAHLTLSPQLGKTLQNGSGQKAVLDNERLEWSAQELAGTLRYSGCCLTLPAMATLAWPKLPHNPYVKDGHAEPAEGRIVITLPFDAQHTRHEVLIEILSAEN
jgi:hypothetical protein